MKTLKWTLSSRKSSLKNCVTTLFPDLLFLLLIFVLSCAPKAVQISPRQNYVDPLHNTDLPATPSYQTGYQEYLQGNQTKARTSFLELVKKRSDYYPAYLALAYSYSAEEKQDYAESYVRKALEIHPDYPQAHYFLSSILEAKQDYEGALAQLNEIEKIDPQYPALGQAQNILKLKVTEQYLNTGRKLADQNPDEALKYLKTAHNMAPEIAQIPGEIAEILLKKNNCQEAIEYLKIAMDRSPDDVVMKTQLADCYVKLNEYQPAKTLYEELALQMPDDASIKQRLEQIKKSIFIEGLPSEYQNIPSTPEITRSQFAAYFSINLEALRKFRSEGQQIAVDIIGNWAQNYIQKVVNLGIMDVYPNRTFQPNQPLTKLDLARAVSRILEIVELSGKKQFSSNSPVDIPDVPPGHIYYSLVAKPIAAGVISLDTDGRFHLSRRVSGAEVLSVVNKLKTIMEPL
jgi:tetratricopeptide (TPR) repeat protein